VTRAPAGLRSSASRGRRLCALCLACVPALAACPAPPRSPESAAPPRTIDADRGPDRSAGGGEPVEYLVETSWGERHQWLWRDLVTLEYRVRDKTGRRTFAWHPAADVGAMVRLNDRDWPFIAINDEIVGLDLVGASDADDVEALAARGARLQSLIVSDETAIPDAAQRLLLGHLADGATLTVQCAHPPFDQAPQLIPELRDRFEGLLLIQCAWNGSQLGAFPSLKRLFLHFAGSTLETAGYAAPGDLESLWTDGAPLRTRERAAFVARADRLADLTLLVYHADADPLRELPRPASLRTLAIDGDGDALEKAPALDAKARAFITRATSVELLVVMGFELDRGALETISRARTLERLALSQDAVSDADLRLLCSLAGLRLLGLHAPLSAWNGIDLSCFSSLESFAMTNAHLPREAGAEARPVILPALQHARAIDLSGSPVGDGALEALRSAAEVRVLLASETSMTDASCDAIMGLGELVVLDLSRNDLDDQCLAGLGRLSKLESLDVSWTKVAGGFSASPAALPRLRSVSLSSTPAGDDALAALGRHRSLELLLLRDTAITDRGLAALAGLTKLQELDLSGCAVRGRSFDSLGSLGSLAVLDLSGTAVDDDALAGLTKLRALRSLDLGQTVVSDAGLARLAELPDLRQLSLYDCPRVTDAGLRELAKARSLRRLDVRRDTSITEAGLADLRRANPRVIVASD
jgi:hypothetical protein